MMNGRLAGRAMPESGQTIRKHVLLVMQRRSVHGQADCSQMTQADLKRIAIIEAVGNLLPVPPDFCQAALVSDGQEKGVGPGIIGDVQRNREAARRLCEAFHQAALARAAGTSTRAVSFAGPAHSSLRLPRGESQRRRRRYPAAGFSFWLFQAAMYRPDSGRNGFRPSRKASPACSAMNRQPGLFKGDHDGGNDGQMQQDARNGGDERT